MSNETEGRSGTRGRTWGGSSIDTLAELDKQYPVATWFLKAELFMLLTAVVLGSAGKGFLVLPGADVWLFHEFYLMNWVLMYAVGAIGIGVGFIYLLWKFFAK